MQRRLPKLLPNLGVRGIYRPVALASALSATAATSSRVSVATAAVALASRVTVAAAAVALAAWEHADVRRRV